MHGVTVFDKHTQVYARWFDSKERVYQAEVDATRKFVSSTGIGTEIGVGAGRFAVLLGVTNGNFG